MLRACATGCAGLAVLLAVFASSAQGEDGWPASVDDPLVPAELVGMAAQVVGSAYDGPAEAMRFYAEQRSASGAIDYGQLEAAKKAVDAMPRALFGPEGIQIYEADNLMGGILSKALGDVSDWTELGPGNIGGRTRALIVDPGNGDVMYAAGVAGGVWKTVNGGLGWTPLDDLMDNLAVCTLAFERQGTAQVNTSVIYAGTGEGMFNGDQVRGAGIFKTADAGVTWSRLSSTDNSDFHYVNKIVASPNNALVLYAATRTGVWKTADGGASWTCALENNGGASGTETAALTQMGFSDIEVRTDLGTDTLLASAGGRLHDLDTDTDGVYRSANGGVSWERVLTSAGMGRCDLAIAPSNQDYMYALAADNANGARLLNVYQSTDGGSTWSPKVTGDFDQREAKWLLLTNPLMANLTVCFPGNDDRLLHQGWFDNVIAVSPTDPEMLFAGGIDLFRSEDGGASWGIISHWWVSGMAGYAHANQHVIVFDPGWNGTSNQAVHVGCDGGIYTTNNALDTAAVGADDDLDGVCYYAPSTPTAVDWVSLNHGYGVTQFYHGRPYPAGSARYLAGAQDNGTLRGSDADGLNGWVEINDGHGGYVGYNPSYTNVVFAEYTGNTLRRAMDGNAAEPTFSPIFYGEASSHFLFIAPFRMDPSDGDRIWYGGWYPFRSGNASSAATPAGITWTQAGMLSPGSGSISAWAIDPNDSDEVYYGTSDGYVMRTKSAGSAGSSTVWDTIVQPSDWGGEAWVSWVEVDKKQQNRDALFATNSKFGQGQKHVLRTIDGGASWEDVTSNLPDIPVHCIVVQPGYSQILFIGTDLGVFVSVDAGQSWASMNTPGFANVVVESLEFQDANTLYAFTHGRGAWRAVVSNTPGDEEILVAPLSLAFPSRHVDLGATPAEPVDIYNTGTEDLRVTDVAVEGTNAGDFIIVEDTGQSVLAPGQRRRLAVAFDPAAGGARSAVLAVRSNDYDSTLETVALSGTGLSSGLTDAYVDVTWGGVESGTSAQPFDTLQEGVDAVLDGGTVHVAQGGYSLAGAVGKELLLVRWGSVGVALVQ